jgi:tetratricopeptide (TPR) repeat protein
MPRASFSSRYGPRILLIVCTLIAMGNLARSEFVSWDDPFNIYQNPRLNPPTLNGIAQYWQHPAFGLYIPLTYSVWGLLALLAQVSPDAQGISLNPWIFHTANLLMHVLSVLIIFEILQLLIRNRIAACIGAMLFAIHPLQVEAVAWAAGMKDVLSGLLALLAIWQYLIYANEPKNKLHYALGLIAFIAAMLSKPSAMVVPIILFAIDFWLLRRNWKSIASALLPWTILAILCAILARIAQPAIGVTPTPLMLRPILAADSLAFYLFKLVWPVKLTIDYGWRPEVISRQWWFYVIWIVPVALAIALTLSRKRQTKIFVAGIIFVAVLSPVLGLVTFLFQFFSSTADHYLYLAMLGPALAAAWAIDHFNRPTVVRIAIVILALLGVRTILQTRFWHDDFALFPHARDVNPHSFMAAYNLGHIYGTMNDLDQAEPLLREAIRLKPDYYEAHQNLAVLLEQRGKFAEAIEHVQRALEIQRARPPRIRIDLAPLLQQLAGDQIELEKSSTQPATHTSMSQ